MINSCAHPLSPVGGGKCVNVSRFRSATSAPMGRGSRGPQLCLRSSITADSGKTDRPSGLSVDLRGAASCKNRVLVHSKTKIRRGKETRNRLTSIRSGRTVARVLPIPSLPPPFSSHLSVVARKKVCLGSAARRDYSYRSFVPRTISIVSTALCFCCVSDSEDVLLVGSEFRHDDRVPAAFVQLLRGGDEVRERGRSAAEGRYRWDEALEDSLPRRKCFTCPPRCRSRTYSITLKVITSD